MYINLKKTSGILLSVINIRSKLVDCLMKMSNNNWCVRLMLLRLLQLALVEGIAFCVSWTEISTTDFTACNLESFNLKQNALNIIIKQSYKERLAFAYKLFMQINVLIQMTEFGRKWRGGHMGDNCFWKGLGGLGGCTWFNPWFHIKPNTWFSSTLI